MSSDKSPSDPIDAKLVRRLASILNDTGLTEIEVERGDLRIRVARSLTAAAAPVQMVAAPAAASPAAAPAPTAMAAPAVAPEIRGDQVKSPMVGTVYLQPQPGAPPFVSVGDLVEEGQTLVLIEAMKTMNPIPAPRSGRLVAMLVSDSQPVEFGEPLAVIE